MNINPASKFVPNFFNASSDEIDNYYYKPKSNPFKPI
jgi:hypothetical protein